MMRSAPDCASARCVLPHRPASSSSSSSTRAERRPRSEPAGRPARRCSPRPRNSSVAPPDPRSSLSRCSASCKRPTGLEPAIAAFEARCPSFRRRAHPVEGSRGAQPPQRRAPSPVGDGRVEEGNLEAARDSPGLPHGPAVAAPRPAQFQHDRSDLDGPRLDHPKLRSPCHCAAWAPVRSVVHFAHLSSPTSGTYLPASTRRESNPHRAVQETAALSVRRRVRYGEEMGRGRTSGRGHGRRHRRGAPQEGRRVRNTTPASSRTIPSCARGESNPHEPLGGRWPCLLGNGRV